MFNVLIDTWIIINVIAVSMLLILWVKDVWLNFINPKVIHNNIKINLFGAWFIALVSNILFPVVAIPYWIYKLCKAIKRLIDKI